MMKGFLRWAGSKRQLLPKLKGYWRELPNRSYIEPFAGSACLFFDLEPTNAIIGDLNQDLMRTLEGLRDNAEDVVRAIRRIRRGSASYYRHRSIDTKGLTPTEHAARFIFLNKYCFNGLYRTNQAGQFNVPYAKPKPQSRGIDYEAIRSAAALLGRARLVAGDFEDTVALAKPGDFVYLDPPYFSSSRRIFGEYMPLGFSSEDLHRLDKVMSNLHEKGVDFLVSYIWSKEHRAIFDRWNVTRVRTKRNIAGFCSDRRGAYEILVTNINR